MKKIIIIGLGLALLAVGCNKKANPDQTNSQVQTGVAEIDMTANGFSPANITVKLGTQVVFKNTDTTVHWPASNPHPTHTDLPGFDALQNVPAGNSYSFTFSKLGQWGFHDHLNPSQFRGSITVVQ